MTSLPHDLDAERAALGAILLSSAAFDEVTAILRPEDYFRLAHTMIHRAALALAARGEPVDAVSVRAGLNGELDRVGGPVYLAGLLEAVPSPASAGFYARIVAEKAARRHGLEIASRAAQIATRSSGDGLAEGYAQAGAELVALADGTAAARPNRLRAALLDSAGLDMLPDPAPLVDGLLYRDSLAWLYGQPGACKSLLALDWAGCVATGKAWQSLPVAAGPVLYVVAEGVRGLGKRKRAWEYAWRAAMTGVVFLPVAVQLLQDAELGGMVDVVAEVRPVMIVLDTQARMTVGVDEN